MMFGFTLRNVMPIRSQMLTFACVNLAWIQRLKYLATKMQSIRAITPTHDDQVKDG